MSARTRQSSPAGRAGFEWFARCDARVEAALRSRFSGASAPGGLATSGAGFSFELPVGDGLPGLDVEVWTRDGWVICEAPLDPSSPRLSALQQLETSVDLAGGAKVVCASGEVDCTCPRLRAEAPLTTGVDVDAVLGAALEGFVEGARRIAGQPTRLSSAAAAGEPVSISGDVRHETLSCARALADAGWTTSSREDGRVFVDLDVGAGYRQALLETSPEGKLRLGYELPGIVEPAPNPCADALAIAALRTSAWVRMVRAVHDAEFRLEVPLGPGLGAEAVGSATAALSVALRLLGDEAEILSRDRAVASQYLKRSTQRKRKQRRGNSRPAAGAEARA